MAGTIWKGELKVTDGPQVQKMPARFNRVVVGLKPNQEPPEIGVARLINYWVEVDSDNEELLCDFEVIGTGHPSPSNKTWIGTVFDDPFVWHIYIGDAYVADTGG